jgi:hypothetical protein
LFEQRRIEEGLGAVRLFEGGIPDNVKRLPIVRLQMIERARPFIGLDHAERMLGELPEPSTPARRLYSIRARLPIAVLREDWPAVEELIVAARELAEPACSPQLLAFANWAESVRDGDVERAGAALDSLNEPYTAARLTVDFLGTIPASEGAELRAATAEALESMGAQASLDELGGY